MSAPAPYRVLARKYRPQRFEELIGQDAMVKTLANAIAGGRLAHAYLLTGVRGVGKTTTARLIAKALNCVGRDGSGGPTISPCDACDPCRAIAEGRFIDVVEIDAASNNGIEDVRELTDQARYAAVSARFKIYIVDEVQMMSKQAFNALLKTLEEPPPHVKFIFATTDVQKLPVTILSRCQRFDLRRIPAETLAAHYAMVAAAEHVEAEAAALAMIARAAEGSARDGLSILDQAIAHGDGAVTAAAVADMLGLADRGATRALMALLLEGRGAEALAALRGQYEVGVDPLLVIEALLGLAHATTRVKLGGAEPGRAAEEAADLKRWADALGMGALHRLWQMLLKGHAEVATAPLPLEAAEMALLRVIHASGLPDPGALVRRLTSEAASVSSPVPTEAAMPDAARAEAPARLPAPPPPATIAPPTSFAALVALFEARREAGLAACLHDHVRPVRYAPPVLELARAGPLPRDFAPRLVQCLDHWTGLGWRVAIGEEGGLPTLREGEEARRAAVLDDPAVKALIAAFPAAELIDYEDAPAMPGAMEERA